MLPVTRGAGKTSPGFQAQQRKGLQACWGPGTRHALKLRDHWWVPSIRLQPLNEDPIQLSGPGKETEGNSHLSGPTHRRHVRAEVMK